MNNLLLQSEYAEIIIELLRQPYNINSITKIVFLSFCIRNETRKSYGNRKADFVDVLLDNLNIKLFAHSDELIYAFDILNKLKECGWIIVEDGKIILLKNLDCFECKHAFLQAYKDKEINPIAEANKLDDKAFIEEVLRHV